MGYSPWGRTESDMAERLKLACSLTESGTGLQLPYLQNGLSEDADGEMTHGVPQSCPGTSVWTTKSCLLRLPPRKSTF